MSEQTETRQRAAPVSGSERLEFVDILRGFAVLGILLVNMLSFAGIPVRLTPEMSQLDRWAMLLLEFLVRAKFYSLFSFLFGWGMAIQMLRAEARGVRFVPVYLRRLLILLAFGFIHGTFIWTGDILTLYANLGFLLLLFRKRSPRFLLLAAALFLGFAIFLNTPGAAADAVRNAYTTATASLRWSLHPDSAYATGTWLEIQARRWQDYVAQNSWTLFFTGNIFAMFLLGLYVGKRRIFEDIAAHRSLLRRVLVVGLVVGVILNGVFIQTMRWNFAGWPGAVDPRYYNLIRISSRTIGAPALTFFYVAGLILLSRRVDWHRRLAPLAPVGRMALTNYLTHSVVGTLIFYNYGFGLYGRIGVAASIVLSLVIFAAQIRFSAWWFERYRFGPVEWLWRTLTYGRRPPLHRGEVEAPPAPAWLQRLQRANPVHLLLVSWLVLLLWGSALFYYYGRLGIGHIEDLPALAGADQEALAALLAGVPGAETGTETEAETETEKEYVPPVLRAARYEPSALVADGNMAALAAAFDVEEALAQIELLSDADFAGRYAGAAGGWAAGDYIAGQFAALGLQPAGDDDTYFQLFSLDSENLAAAPSLSITGPDGSGRDDYLAYADFAPVAHTYMGAGSASGPVVWANDCSRDDFNTVDVVDAIVFCRGLGRISYSQAARNALEQGAGGLLLLADTGVRPLDFGATYFAAWVPEPLPTVRVDPEVAADLLAGSERSLAELSYNFISFPLATTAAVTVATSGAAGCAADPCQGRNVLGVLPGRNPDYAGEVVIIGGHYDHLGAAPAGPVWAGANDNASGIGVMLEIARTWQANGFVPQRTVLFAAWDGEEMGLLGSRYYVDNPRFLLEDTVAALQLDMVGAGPEALIVDGGGALEPTIALAASQLGITTTLTSIGRSDHVPFMDAGVPANLISWFDGGDDLSSYHRPEDTMAIIDPARVEAAGRIASLTILGVAEGVPQIQALLAKRAAAVLAGDAAAFAATTAPGERADARAWLAAATALEPTDFRIQLNDLTTAGQAATAAVTYVLTTGSGDAAANIALELTGRIEQRGGAWVWGGADLAPVPGTGTFTMRAPAATVDSFGDFNQVLTEQYEAWSSLLGLIPGAAPRVSFYNTPSELRADTDLSLRADTTYFVGPGHIRLSYSREVSQSERVDQALAQLILSDAGVTAADAPWLWQGLPAALLAIDDREAVFEDLLAGLEADLAAGDSGAAAAWAAVTYLQRQLGWEGLGAFIADVGAGCGGGGCPVDTALNRALGVDAAGFDAAWRGAWTAEIETAQAALADLLTARAAAAQAGDTAGWLAPVDGDVPGLAADEQAWLNDLTSLAPAAVELSGRPVVLYDDGSFRAEVTTSFTIGERESSQTALIDFRRRGDEVFWAGAPLSTLAADGVTIFYPAGAEAVAAALLPVAQALISDVAELLAQPPLTGLVVRLYPDETSLRRTVSPLLARSDWVDGWTAVGGSLQLALDAEMDLNGPPEMIRAAYGAQLAELLARRYLYDQGVTDDWLLTGLPLVAADRLGYSAAVVPYFSRLSGVVSGVTFDRLAPLAEWTVPYSMPETDAVVVIAQAWDSLRYLADSAGLDQLLALAAAQAGGQARPAAAAAIGGMEAFEAAWIESLNRGHAAADWFTLLDGFDIDRALAHVAALTDPALAGRQAGSPGAWQAADYIAAEFAALGLLPVGDGAPAGDPFAGGDDYFQRFDITYTELTASPVLSFAVAGSATPAQFLYREEFMLAVTATGGYGDASGQLIWVGDGSYEGIELDGNIVIREPEFDYRLEMERAAAHGAGGLILIDHTLNAAEEILAKPAIPVTFADTPVIPVVVLTNDGMARFLEVSGTTPVTFDRAGAALPLAVSVEMSVPLSPPAPGQSANVLALLPGADPALRDEVIIIGAHYDFVGDDPDLIICDGLIVADAGRADDAGCQRLPGFAYPGANDDASGVAALLELARLWTTGSYRPGRSILFAAWGAQEAGEVGSRFYLEQPVFPPAATAFMIQLDSVGGGEGFRVLAEGWRDQVGALMFGMEAGTRYFDNRLQTTIPDARSDSTPFLEAGVPSLLVSWVDARDLNLPDFEADPITPEWLQLSGQLIGLAVMIAAG